MPNLIGTSPNISSDASVFPLTNEVTLVLESELLGFYSIFKKEWGIRIFFLHCKNGRALVLPVDMRRKGEDGLGQFGPALFACKALPFVSCKKKMPMPH